MQILSPRERLAIAALVQVAMSSTGSVSAKEISALQGTMPRYLEPTLQSLVHNKILKGVRGPKGGYSLWKQPKDILLSAILAAVSPEDSEDKITEGSVYVHKVVDPLMTKALESLIANATKTFTLATFVDEAKSQLKPRTAKAA